jgi:gliding motility-associated-like protein
MPTCQKKLLRMSVLVFILLGIIYSKQAKAQVNVGDSLALVALYNVTDGPNWTNNTNWLTGTVDTWYGITVVSNRVAVINLSSNLLNGSIPSDLGTLSNLQQLRLEDNQLTGPIPSELGNLSLLTLLYLDNNQIAGTVPSELGNLSNLLRLQLDNNQLTGPVPFELGNLNNLTQLYLNNNQFTGTIPSELGNLGNLQRLWLSFNQLTGTIPSELGNLSNLQQLNLGSNSLNGLIPPELGNLTNLQRLWLYLNQLTGTIPSELGNLSNLIALDLQDNQLSGDIPIVLGNLTNLTFLQIRLNQLTGNIPIELGNLTNLTDLWLSNNQLTGTMPTELGQIAPLRNLDLNSNILSGEIPGLLFPELTYIDLSNNNFSGELPTATLLIPNIQSIKLNSNNLTGALPIEITTLPFITELNLSDNQFDSLPDLTPLTTLTDFKVHTNNFTYEDLEVNMSLFIDSTHYSPQNLVGIADSFLLNQGDTLSLSIPVGGSANQYQWQKDGVDIVGATNDLLELASVTTADNGIYKLLISNSIVSGLTLESAEIVVNVEPPSQDQAALLALYNTTNGPNWRRNDNWNTSAPLDQWYGVTVKNGRVAELNLANNNLVGFIPSEIGFLAALETFSAWRNSLTGSLPVEIAGLDSLKIIQLFGNQLSGELPQELGDMPSLDFLSLADNQFTGTIPPVLGNLVKLTFLGLRGNQFSGEIPPELGNLSELTNLRLENCLLTGPFPPELANLQKLEWLYLNDNQLSGPVPNEITELSQLEILSIQNNNLDYLPDLNTLDSLQVLSISNNKFTYADILPNQSLITENTSQQPFGDSTVVQAYTFEGLRLDPTLEFVDGQEYQWFKDDIPLSGGTNHYYEISDFRETDGGMYTVEVYHPDVPNLTLIRNPLQVQINEGDPPRPQAVEVISPNGDDINDEMTIKKIELYPDHRVLIYDVLGRLVYETTEYDNINNPFIGIGNTNGYSELPSGTYYYLIDVGDTKKNGTGYFVMKRR